jgi:uncharacterized membrane protein
METKLKHLEFIQTAIGRMSTNSFLFKGWAITLAAALSSFAAVETRRALLVIAIFSTVLFWSLDAYYLWLERRFRDLYDKVRIMPLSDIDFAMSIDKDRAFKGWLGTCKRLHLIVFYGAIIVIDVVGIVMLKTGR